MEMLRTIGLLGWFCVMVSVPAARAEGSPGKAPSPQRSAPIVTDLKPGDLEITLLDRLGGEPRAGVSIELEAPGPGARRLSATTDAAGRATIRVPHGAQYQHLVHIDGHAVGVVRFWHTAADYSSCTIVFPADYAQLPAGRPDLLPSFVSGGLVLTATKTPVPPPTPELASPPAQEPDMAPGVQTLNGFLGAGRIREGLQHYADSESNAERFALGFLQALDGLQQFSAGMNRFRYKRDLDEFRASAPFLRVTVLGDAQPGAWVTATPEGMAALFVGLRDALRRANATLAAMDDTDFKVEVNLSRIRLDLSGDGKAGPDELLITALGPALGIRDADPHGEDIVVRFDSADAKWLEGYTHLLTGLLDVLLAYDWRPVWDQVAHVFLVPCHPEPPIARVARPTTGITTETWSDLIAGLHAMRLEAIDADGLRRARDEFKAMVACSRVAWRRILAETDDDKEWIPSPSQSGPGGARVTQAEVDGWMRILDELDAVLAGERLLPHWRLLPGRGVDLNALVESPPRLDPILLIQGSALVPYIREGDVSDGARWRHLIGPFGNGFFRFAVWVN